MENKLILILNTIKYLRFKQIYYRICYILKKRNFNKSYQKTLKKKIKPLVWKEGILYKRSFYDNTFKFINVSHCFLGGIDWNYSEFGKLWTFNLNYFDFLNQKNIAPIDGLNLINDYIGNDNILKEGKESYTISLRGINWIKFLSKNNIQNHEVNQTLFSHYQRLLDNLELHFLGNHYLENGFSLLFGAYYFKDDKLYKAAKKVLTEELEEQVLNDGAHFELSPMYHQTMLHRVLDCLNLITDNAWKKNHELHSFLKEKAIKMLSWLQKTTYRNGNIPMVNDSSYDIAPTSKELFEYGKSLNLSWEKGMLSDSGYRKIENENYELFIDVGNVGAPYQPAHVHSDTFNFELYNNEKPVIVDTGTSTYEKNQLRHLERSTESHNTVKIGDINQSEVWSGFRVAKRAKIVNLKESTGEIEATHNGYKGLDILHTRKFITKTNKIIIEDRLSKKSKHRVNAYLHFYPGIEIIQEGNIIKLKRENMRVDLRGEINNIEILDYDYAIGFNKVKKAKKLQIDFVKELDTHIYL